MKKFNFAVSNSEVILAMKMGSVNQNIEHQKTKKMNQQTMDGFCSSSSEGSLRGIASFQGLQPSEFSAAEAIQKSTQKSIARNFPFSGTGLAMGIMLLAWVGFAYSGDVITERLCIATAIISGLYCFRNKA